MSNHFRTPPTPKKNTNPQTNPLTKWSKPNTRTKPSPASKLPSAYRLSHPSADWRAPHLLGLRQVIGGFSLWVSLPRSRSRFMWLLFFQISKMFYVSWKKCISQVFFVVVSLKLPIPPPKKKEKKRKHSLPLFSPPPTGVHSPPLKISPARRRRCERKRKGSPTLVTFIKSCNSCESWSCRLNQNRETPPLRDIVFVLVGRRLGGGGCWGWWWVVA